VILGVENDKQALSTVEGDYFPVPVLGSKGWIDKILCSGISASKKIKGNPNSSFFQRTYKSLIQNNHPY